MVQWGPEGPALSAILGLDEPLKAALIIKRTGAVVAGWIQDGANENVVAVMSATLLGSLDTLVETLGGRPPKAATIDTDDCRLMAVRVDSQTALVLVASRQASDTFLRHIGRQVLQATRLAPPRNSASRKSIVVSP